MFLTREEIEQLINSGELVVEPRSAKTIFKAGLNLTLGNDIRVLVKGVNKLFLGKKDDKIKLKSLHKKIEPNKDGEVTFYPNYLYLASTNEYIKLPHNIIGFVKIHPTLASSGFYTPPVVVRPKYEGKLYVLLVPPPFAIEVKVGTDFVQLLLAKATTLKTHIVKHGRTQHLSMHDLLNI